MSLEIKENLTTTDKLRKRLTSVMGGVAVLSGASGLIIQLLSAASNNETISMVGLSSTGFVIVVGVLVIQLAQRNQTELSILLLSGAFLIGYFVVDTRILLLLGMLIMISIATLRSNMLFVLITIIVIARYILLLYEIGVESDFAFTEEGGRLSIEMSVIFTIGMMSRFFLTASEENSGQIERTNELLQASAEIGQITTKLVDLDSLFNHSVELIRNRFGYYHVQIFTVDDAREYARLAASTGRAGEQLLARGHRLVVGSQSVIGRVTQTGEPVVTRDTDRTSAVHAHNELLPNTRSELALPILDGERIIGALDVQSTRDNAFTPNDVQALQVIANQIGIVIRNARLFEQQELSVRENKRLFFESETNLREIQRLNRQLTKNAWESFLEVEEKAEGVTITNDGLKPAADWSDTMIDATQKGKATRAQDGSGVLAIPIILRGEILGAIEIKPSANFREDDTIEMVQNIAQRLAITLDNARLFEEAQASTRQEQQLNNIVSRYQAADSIDELLQITLTELSETLGAKEGAIRLGSVSNQAVSTANNGHSPNGNHNDNDYQNNGGTPS